MLMCEGTRTAAAAAAAAAAVVAAGDESDECNEFDDMYDAELYLDNDDPLSAERWHLS